MKRTFLRNILIIVAVLFIHPYVFGEKIHKNIKDESRILVVVIDPGHGGKDWGASVGNTKEKDIVLDIALKLGNLIKKSYPDIKIVYTRNKDIFIPLYKRADIANKNEADLFISIHVNAVDARYVQGTETFVLGLHRNKDNLEVAKKENAVILLEDDYNSTYEGFDPNSPESYIMFELIQDEYLEQSVLLASEIQTQFREHAKRSDRSVKQAGFLVLRRTTMPSVLIETGFISHSSERKFLTSEQGKSNLASSICNAFKVYKKEIEQKSAFNLVTETNSTTETKPSPPVRSSKPDKQNQDNNIWFSVQVMALKQKIEPSPGNFKGERNIFRVDDKKISRYFSGRFNTLEKAKDEQNRIEAKYNSAFVVAFEDDKLISVKKATGKL
ncbi:MAG: N-acetylmuramoyl-L-alanine amidase [Bacteroidota bacterium]